MRIRIPVVMALLVSSTALASTAHARDLAPAEPTTQHVAGLVVASLGVIGFASGVFLGRDRAKRDDSLGSCSADVCDSMASLLIADARAQNETAFQLMGFGALAMLGGAALYSAAPKASAGRSYPSASIALGAGGILFKTTF